MKEFFCLSITLVDLRFLVHKVSLFVIKSRACFEPRGGYFLYKYVFQNPGA